ncbi:hypothetical protein CBR_g21201 [Chara braunii]|uniref:Uncharacterized protein n=1 Tax=Chara braunii TaxID=69332 RepID=A0A388L0Y6_CHABU|nr:hypothetical protein CBR_g21201 [Chara braunii]|eukprot:GBG75959.1 hypothetical protein CBR_g21201 [Chara braunii]
MCFRTAFACLAGGQPRPGKWKSGERVRQSSFHEDEPLRPTIVTDGREQPPVRTKIVEEDIEWPPSRPKTTKVDDPPPPPNGEKKRPAGPAPPPDLDDSLLFDSRRFAMEDNPVIGIDLGTSYCCVAVFRNIDKIEVIPNALGRRLTPSYVAFAGEDGCLVGDVAKKHGMTNPAECIFEVKRLMGRSFRDATVQEDAKKWPFKVSSGLHGEVVVSVPQGPGRASSMKPEDISARLLRTMKQIAEDFADCPITDAVITVPAYFNHSQRKATMAAGVSAGLKVLRLMSEPTAAALAYSYQQLIRKEAMGRTVLVFDLGGGTFDVSIVTIDAVRRGQCSFVVNAVAGDSHLGGADIDRRLLRHVAKQFKKQLRGEDVLGDPMIFPLLNQAVVDAKHVLSSAMEADINLDYHDRVLSLKLGRAEFESLNQDLFDRCMTIVEQALKDAKISKHEVSDVVLAGGSTKIPRVREMLTAFFGKEPIKSVNAEEAVAFGAALQAGLLARSDRSAEARRVSVRDVTSLSIGVDTTKFGIMRVVIPRNSPLPASGSTTYALLDNQESLTAALYEGERALCAYNRFLGELTLEGFTPGPATDQPAVKIVLTLDVHGILHATAEVLAKHRDIGRKVEATVTLDTDVAHSLAFGAEATDCYTPEAKAEDARIWAAKESMDRLRNLIGGLRKQHSSSNKSSPANLERCLTEAWAWYTGLQEMASKEEYDKKYEEVKLLTGG